MRREIKGERNREEERTVIRKGVKVKRGRRCGQSGDRKREREERRERRKGKRRERERKEGERNREMGRQRQREDTGMRNG